MIEKIEIDNFKSFESFKVELAPFNVFVGPNGCGKTNFIDAFHFIKDSHDEGVGVATRKRFGWQGTRCRKILKENITFIIEGIPKNNETISIVGDKQLNYKKVKFYYKLSFKHESGKYIIVDEHARLSGSKNGRRVKVASFDRGEKKVSFLPLAVAKSKKVDVGSNSARMFLSAPFSGFVSAVITEEIEGWRTYNPDPEKARSPHLIEDKADVTETGDTLAVVLHMLKSARTQESKFVRGKILSVMQMLVPGFRDWETEELPDGRICFWVKEKAIRGKLPPDLISNGTIRLLTLLCGLLFKRENHTVVFIEEPELCLHPSIMETLVDIIREVSQQHQIIITTHSADFVRYCRPEEVFLMDKVNGLTKVIKAEDIKQINKFLELFSLDKLWLQGYLKKGLPL